MAAAPAISYLTYQQPERVKITSADYAEKIRREVQDLIRESPPPQRSFSENSDKTQRVARPPV